MQGLVWGVAFEMQHQGSVTMCACQCKSYNRSISFKIKRLFCVAAAGRISFFFFFSLWSLEKCFWTTQATGLWILIMFDCGYNHISEMVKCAGPHQPGFWTISIGCGSAAQCRHGPHRVEVYTVYALCSGFLNYRQAFWMHFITTGDIDTLKSKQVSNSAL